MQFRKSKVYSAADAELALKSVTHGNSQAEAFYREKCTEQTEAVRASVAEHLAQAEVKARATAQEAFQAEVWRA